MVPDSTGVEEEMENSCRHPVPHLRDYQAICSHGSKTAWKRSGLFLCLYLELRTSQACGKGLWQVSDFLLS